MNVWLQILNTEDKEEMRQLKKWHTGAPACGTVGCITGWAALLGGAPAAQANYDASSIAHKLLGDDAAANLFYFFPDNHTHLKPGTLKYAKAVVRHIETYMKTHTAELKARKIKPPPVRKARRTKAKRK